MHLCDEVAGIAAVRHSGARVVTAAMDRMSFRHPVFVGQLVTVKATVNAAWRTSMEVGVRVESENVRTGEVLHTSTAYLTMVALDEYGNPTGCRRSTRGRPTRRGGRARHSCVATPASPSGSGSRRSGRSERALILLQRLQREPRAHGGEAGSRPARVTTTSKPPSPSAAARPASTAHSTGL